MNIIDSCLVKNGGCDCNAVCSHDSKTNAVLCNCKTGYTNTGSDSNVICTGMFIRAMACIKMIQFEDIMNKQKVL